MAVEPKHIPEEDEISLKELILSIQGWIAYLWSKWRILLIAGILGGIIGLGYAWLKQPMYTASTSFVLESNDSRSGLGRLSGMAALAGIDLGADVGGLFQGDNILELYKSRKMLEETLLTKVSPNSGELLVERYIAYNKIGKDWEDQPELLALDFRQDPESLDSLSLRLRDGVITSFTNAIREDVLLIEKVEKNLSIIKVDITSPDEVFSKAFNENLVRNVNEFYTQTKIKKSTDNISILEAKVDSVRSVMANAIYSAASVSDATPNLNPTRQVQRIAPAQEAQFSAEANKTMLAQLLQNLELTKMNLLQDQPLIQLIDEPVFPLKVDQVGNVKGAVVGVFLFGFLAMLYLVGKKWYDDVIGDEN